MRASLRHLAPSPLLTSDRSTTAHDHHGDHQNNHTEHTDHHHPNSSPQRADFHAMDQVVQLLQQFLRRRSAPQAPSGPGGLGIPGAPAAAAPAAADTHTHTTTAAAPDADDFTQRLLFALYDDHGRELFAAREEQQPAGSSSPSTHAPTTSDFSASTATTTGTTKTETSTPTARLHFDYRALRAKTSRFFNETVERMLVTLSMQARQSRRHFAETVMMEALLRKPVQEVQEVQEEVGQVHDEGEAEANGGADQNQDQSHQRDPTTTPTTPSPTPTPTHTPTPTPTQTFTLRDRFPWSAAAEQRHLMRSVMTGIHPDHAFRVANVYGHVDYLLTPHFRLTDSDAGMGVGVGKDAGVGSGARDDDRTRRRRTSPNSTSPSSSTTTTTTAAYSTPTPAPAPSLDLFPRAVCLVVLAEVDDHLPTRLQQVAVPLARACFDAKLLHRQQQYEWQQYQHHQQRRLPRHQGEGGGLPPLPPPPVFPLNIVVTDGLRWHFARAYPYYEQMKKWGWAAAHVGGAGGGSNGGGSNSSSSSSSNQKHNHRGTTNKKDAPTSTATATSTAVTPPTVQWLEHPEVNVCMEQELYQPGMECLDRESIRGLATACHGQPLDMRVFTGDVLHFNMDHGNSIVGILRYWLRGLVPPRHHHQRHPHRPSSSLSTPPPSSSDAEYTQTTYWEEESSSLE